MKRLAAVLIAAPLFLTGCVVPYGGATPAVSTNPPAGAKIYSKLDAAGIEQIKYSKTVLLDVTSGHLRKSDVGLEDGTSQAPDVHVTGGLMDLFIEGPDGVIAANTDHVRLNGMNSRSDFSEVTYFLTADSLDGLIKRVRDGIDRYGINKESAEDWIQSISAKPDQKSEFAIGTGTKTGLQVTYDLRYDGSKNTQVIIVHVNPLCKQQTPQRNQPVSTSVGRPWPKAAAIQPTNAVALVCDDNHGMRRAGISSAVAARLQVHREPARRICPRLMMLDRWRQGRLLETPT